MYPTVCTLMGLWRFVISEGIDQEDATEAVRECLASISLSALRRPETWPELRVLVEVQPDGDLFPVRAKYGQDAHYTIALNHLTSETPLWFTLADCIAAVILGGKVPKVLRAVRFTPRRCQGDLRSVAIAGNPDYRVNPEHDDFYSRLIELRAEVKGRGLAAEAGDRPQRETEQQALKILANSTSYGIFVELNVEQPTEPVTATCHGLGGEPFPIRVPQVEEPGRYFHPLLATLITGAARLLLAVTERLITEQGLDWVFCDTGGMAIAMPPDMEQPTFDRGVAAVRDWFGPLNPYSGTAGHSPLLKLEDANYGLTGGEPGREVTLLYCLAVSPKRYALFNLGGAGRPVLRKASAHGLGHLRDPYHGAASPPDIPAPALRLSEIGVDRWQYDVWYRIVVAALNGHPEQVRLHDLPNFDQPAVSRYAATTPQLLGWFKGYNTGKPYRQQVRPFNFLLAFQAMRPEINTALEAQAGNTATARPSAAKNLPRAVAPYDRNPVRAAAQCFDRETGEPVARRQLKTVTQSLARYHLRPDRKVLRGDYRDAGTTHPLHVRAMAIHFIGKEANRWEEQFHLGEDAEAQAEYGTLPSDRDQMAAMVRDGIHRHGAQAVASRAGITRQHVAAVAAGASTPSPTVLEALARAVAGLNAERDREAADIAQHLQAIRQACKRHGIRHVARIAGIDDANLGRIVAGKRKASPAMRRLMSAVIGRLQGPPTQEPS